MCALKAEKASMHQAEVKASSGMRIVGRLTSVHSADGLFDSEAVQNWRLPIWQKCGQVVRSDDHSGNGLAASLACGTGRCDSQTIAPRPAAGPSPAGMPRTDRGTGAVVSRTG